MSDDQTLNPFAPPRANVDDRTTRQEELVLADRWTRFLAFLVDGLPPAVLGIAAAVLLPAWRRRDGLQWSPIGMALVLVAVLAAVGWGIYNIVLIYGEGQSFGKKVMGIRMVRSDGTRMSFARFFFLRCLAVGLLGAIPVLGYIIRIVDYLLIFRDSRQCLHDQIADTLVATAASSRRATLAGSRHEPLRTFTA